MGPEGWRPSPHLLQTCSRPGGCREAWWGPQGTCSALPLGARSGSLNAQHLASAHPLPPQAWAPWHTCRASVEAGARRHPVRALPRGTWPWPPALHPAPPRQPPRFRPKRGDKLHSGRTFPSTAALAGVQTGGRCPGSGERALVEGADLPWRAGGGRAGPSGAGAWPLWLGTRGSASSRAPLTLCRTHTFLMRTALELTDETRQVGHRAEAAGPPGRPQGLGGGRPGDTNPGPGIRGV